MITLHTKNGRKTGNAIIYGGEDHPELGPLFLIETDFGNRLKLTAREIGSMFTLGRVNDFTDWSADRDYLRERNA